MSLKVYVASPLGFSEAGRHFYEGQLLPMIRAIGFEIIDPWTLTSPDLIRSATSLPYGAARRDRWAEVNPIIGDNNAIGIRQADLLVAILDGVDVDSGTAAEVGFATGLGIPSVGYRGDFRLSADNEGSTVNLQVEYFIGLHGGKIVQCLEDLRVLLIEWHGRLTTTKA
jgi:nucleoside 2-deoxyribosyltransferase